MTENSKKMKKIILSILIVLIAIGCSKTEQSNDTFPLPININTTLLLKYNLYGNGQENILEQKIVIDNQADLNILQAKMNLANMTQIPANISINFQNEIVLAVFDKVQGTGGHTIDIIDVTENPQNIVITVVKTNLNGYATTVITQPFHLVKIPKPANNKPLIFL